ncbi:hypothetical protein [Actinophytocola oryzae]|uniref:Uncharacterized protein n=1 Tax=Actinophytocola oryzae TaxID=502181 RepID=A0A4R7V2Z0_9PSEU|nr:hypothetical protein [Actinophytocola oryzae]TDV43689.1 hypothetical protein CLV71_115152 [Actinophytocola oryzae]
MRSSQTPGRSTPGASNAAVYARLAAIERHVAEIAKRLDEMKILITTLDLITPNHQHQPDNEEKP